MTSKDRRKKAVVDTKDLKKKNKYLKKTCTKCGLVMRIHVNEKEVHEDKPYVCIFCRPKGG